METNGFPKTDVKQMSERELLEEVVTQMRAIIETIDALSNHPMISAISSGQNPLMAMTMQSR